MLSLTDMRGTHPTVSELRATLPRGGIDIDSVIPTVQPIVKAVKKDGVAAAKEYGQRFDGVVPESIRVPHDVIADAVDSLDVTVREALEHAIERVRRVHAAIKPGDNVISVTEGGVVTEKFIPVGRVGLYVPGGQAVYPSSVIMNVVPAQEAGVGSLVVASPPQKECGGWPHPTILAACGLLGVDEVWSVGGAQAIALMAYGDERTDDPLVPVDMVTGPGNIFVTAAKRLCRGVVGIDAEAGPTEIAIIADSSADPVHVAYDLISQAEHDPMAASVLITDSASFAQQVDEEVEKRYSITRNTDRVAQALQGKQSGIILVDDIPAAIRVSDAYAPEHLEIQTHNAREDAAQIRNAGAIFVGPFSPVPLGDYAAGSNHVLPTSGSARYNSGLSTHTFVKSVHVIEYDEAALKGTADTIVSLSNAEQLPAHGEAVRARFEDLTAGNK
ncbi:histidinol dehydrogenase [uncultured Corynebacterium sp.]|uniref:histidinol dehydrogenase n=1 Tax=uncultured Corynebacterium sp. TaxID=159447 RepID=UPI0025DB872C|nr:histidinol dehydrogenase [uncultured Corynebacterium sp.]